MHVSIPKKRRFLDAAAALLVSSALLSGCACLGAPPPKPEIFTLAYPSPIFSGSRPVSELIRVHRFAPVEAYAVTTMVIGANANKRDIYPDVWWSVHPGFLVTDLLIRDMRRSGLFGGVFSYRDDADARYIVGGTVEEFLEQDEEAGPSAVIAVTVSLLDQTARKDASKGVVFQKAFQEREPMTVKSPQALAAAMSAAMERLSRAIQNDVYEAIRSRPDSDPEDLKRSSSSRLSPRVSPHTAARTP